MITTPLAPIVALLRRHGASLACLEGAPYQPDPETNTLDVLDSAEVDRGIVSDGGLYLGTNAICPAALGWASEVLALATGREPGAIHCATSTISHAGHVWFWGGKPSVCGCCTALPDPEPNSPAARLKTVIEYEVSR